MSSTYAHVCIGSARQVQMSKKKKKTRETRIGKDNANRKKLGHQDRIGFGRSGHTRHTPAEENGGHEACGFHESSRSSGMFNGSIRIRDLSFPFHLTPGSTHTLPLQQPLRFTIWQHWQQWLAITDIVAVDSMRRGTSSGQTSPPLAPSSATPRISSTPRATPRSLPS